MYHVGVYEGGDDMVAATTSGEGVQYQSFSWAGDTVTFGTHHALTLAGGALRSPADLAGYRRLARGGPPLTADRMRTGILGTGAHVQPAAVPSQPRG